LPALGMPTMPTSATICARTQAATRQTRCAAQNAHVVRVLAKAHERSRWGHTRLQLQLQPCFDAHLALFGDHGRAVAVGLEGGVAAAAAPAAQHHARLVRHQHLRQDFARLRVLHQRAQRHANRHVVAVAACGKEERRGERKRSECRLGQARGECGVRASKRSARAAAWRGVRAVAVLALAVQAVAGAEVHLQRRAVASGRRANNHPADRR
jgi:hypothetical protein